MVLGKRQLLHQVGLCSTGWCQHVGDHSIFSALSPGDCTELYRCTWCKYNHPGDIFLSLHAGVCTMQSSQHSSRDNSVSQVQIILHISLCAVVCRQDIPPEGDHSISHSIANEENKNLKLLPSVLCYFCPNIEFPLTKQILSVGKICIC